MSEEAPLFDLKQTVTPHRFLSLWRMLIGYRAIYLGATLSIGLAAVSRTSFYYLLRYFTDQVLGVATMQNQLPLIALGFMGLALLEGLFTFLSGRWAAQAAEGLTVRLRDYLYDHIQRLSFAYHDKTPTGELIQRVTSDVEAVRRFYAEEAIGFGRIISLFLVNVVALFSLNVRLTLYSIVVIPVLLVVSILFFRKISIRYELFQEQEAKLSTTLQENLSGVRVVKAFARQSYEQKKFEADNWEKYVRGQRLVTLHSLYWPVTDILAGGQMLIGFFIGAQMAIAGTITVGTFLAYIGMLAWIIWPMRNIGRLIVQMSTGLVSASRITEILKEEREQVDTGRYRPTGPLRGNLVFEHVYFAYDGHEQILHDINFQCRAGDVVALIGSTGSGKSSLVHLLPRFYDYQGSIRLDGVELCEYPRHYLRQQIGIVQQEPFLFSRTIRDNIIYGVGRDVSDAEVEAAARAAAIHEVILTFPNGYDTLVGERGVTLSGGQKQRLTLARTLLKDPRILILDDATSSVDMETEAEIRAALDKLLPGRTSFIIAHRVQTVMNADQILVFDRGRIVQRGTHEELMRQDGTYRQIYELQSRIEDELQEDLAEVIERDVAGQTVVDQNG